MKPSGPGLLFAGRFLITVSISVLVMGLLRFSISSWFSFANCTCLRKCELQNLEAFILKKALFCKYQNLPIKYFMPLRSHSLNIDTWVDSLVCSMTSLYDA